MTKRKVACYNCRYFRITNEGTEEQVFECRRYAPHVLSGSGTGWSKQLFPYIYADDWCGEYKPKEME